MDIKLNEGGSFNIKDHAGNDLMTLSENGQDSVAKVYNIPDGKYFEELEDSDLEEIVSNNYNIAYSSGEYAMITFLSLWSVVISSISGPESFEWKYTKDQQSSSWSLDNGDPKIKPLFDGKIEYGIDVASGSPHITSSVANYLWNNRGSGVNDSRIYKLTKVPGILLTRYDMYSGNVLLVKIISIDTGQTATFETTITGPTPDGTNNYLLREYLQPKYYSGSATWDTTPTSGSTKPVTSGGIFDALAGKVAFDLDLGVLEYPGSYKLTPEMITLIRTTISNSGKKIIYCKVDGKGPAPAGVLVARATSSSMIGSFTFEVFCPAFSSSDYSGTLGCLYAKVTGDSAVTMDYSRVGSLYKHVLTFPNISYTFVLVTNSPYPYTLDSLYSGSWKANLVSMYCQAVGSGIVYPCDYMDRHLPHTGNLIPVSPTSLGLCVVNQVEYALQDGAVVRNTTYHLEQTTVSSLTDTVTPL